jgi:hypothetical protein
MGNAHGETAVATIPSIYTRYRALEQACPRRFSVIEGPRADRTDQEATTLVVGGQASLASAG